MNSALYNKLFNTDRKIFILLIDPENQTESTLANTIDAAAKSSVDALLLGGSLTSLRPDDVILSIKKKTDIPVLLFPGNLMQLSPYADGILLLSLISGRNPEFLIGNHVMASMYIKRTGIEVIPTGYILVGSQTVTSVEYMSNTKPVPEEKPDIVTATALAGEQLGLKLIYLETGSGANGHVSGNIVSAVKSEVNIPVIAGGGIKTPADVRNIYQSGAKGVVVGTAVEKDFTVLHSLAAVKNEF